MYVQDTEKKVNRQKILRYIFMCVNIYYIFIIYLCKILRFLIIKQDRSLIIYQHLHYRLKVMSL